VVASAVILSGCETTTVSGVTNKTPEQQQREALCGTPEKEGILKPISWSQADTDQTILEAKQNNAVYKELCLNKAPQQ
jgi:hypothetical protein